MKEHTQEPGRTATGSRLNIASFKAQCEAASEHEQTGENAAEDGWCIKCNERWPCNVVYLSRALEALEEAHKVVSILKACGMNLKVVQVPPPIIDHKRLYALKDAINAYDAILGESK